MNSDEVRLGDVRFDPTTRALSFNDGHPARLRNKSKDVLLYLVNHRDRTVTKNEIIDAVWPDVTVSDESLVQCIADIRRVIGDDAREIVETVPREGYRLHMRDGKTSDRIPKLLIALAAALILVPAWVIWQNSFGPPLPKVLARDVRTEASQPGTANRQAYLAVLQGRASASLYNGEENLVAERNFRRAIELDPTYARAYAELGTVFAVRLENNWTVLEKADRAKALFYAEKAVGLDPDLGLGHYALGRLHSVLGNLDTAEVHLRRAMSLEPENEDARAYFATVRIFQGDAEGALEILEPAVRSHPNPPYWYYLSLGNAYFNLGQNEAAEEAFLMCLVLSKNSPYCLRFLIAVYGEMGRTSDAMSALADYEALGFDISTEAILELIKFHHPDGRARLEKAYRSAGLPP